MSAKKPRSKNFIIGALRKIVKNPDATVRQKLDALDRLAFITKEYTVDLNAQRSRPKPLAEETPVVEDLSSTDEGEELLRRFNEAHYNKGGVNAGS